MIKPLVAEYIQSLVPYPPGKPIEELEREYGVKNSIKLASNENALGPSPKAVEAIKAALGRLHRYPDGSGYYLKKGLGEKLGLSMENIVLGNGSNELIELIVRTFLNPGDEAITSDPTFLVYRKMVQAVGGRNIVVPLKEGSHDLAGIAKAVTARTRLIFLDNPNNPMGTIVAKKAFEQFLKDLPPGVIVVADEAYYDFVTTDSTFCGLDYLDSPYLVITLRTFSKAYGLAGLRIGYGVMKKELSEYINRIRQPFNVNSLAQVGALAALSDEEHLARTKEMVREGLNYLTSEIGRLGYRCLPTQTNFFLIDIKTDGKAVYEKLLRKGVIVRPMHAYKLPGYIRITVGLPAENERFLTAFKEVMGTHGR
ncbi:MAG: histidinol-phosphate transaminase [Thermodesulfobacteriota bacterium]